MSRSFTGHERPVSFRLLHILEFRDNRISRENVWMDVAALHRQLSDDSPSAD
jgi:predicted ester cyclase